MRKIAFFVEGLTEQLFVVKYITEIYGQSKVAISSIKVFGGKSSKIRFTSLRADAIDSDKEYYILIYDCGGDSSIKSYILNQRQSLIKQGYEKIIGLRDVYPINRVDIPKLKSRLYFQLPQKQVSIDIILSIMEIETWFLSESTHFSKIDAGLDIATIVSTLGFNPQTDNIEDRDNPAKDLHDCYQIVRRNYAKKSEKILSRTINSLDYGDLYLTLPDRIPSLREFKTYLDEFFK